MSNFFKYIFVVVFLSMSVSASISTIVSIAPQKSIVKSIGGDSVDITVMVEPGFSPHSYEPLPSQMRAISKADIYFAIGVEFELAWLPRFKSPNSSMEIVHLDKGIKKYPIAGVRRDARLDPHIWTSPSNLKIIARNCFEALIQKDPNSKELYKEGYNKLLQTIDNTDKKIKQILSNVPKGSTFMVFHPSWGYFAKEYGLKQLAIEVGGKSPKPKQLAKIISVAKKVNAKAIFVQPEFSDKSAKLIAKELDIAVVKISPLSPNWSDTLIKLAKAIANKR